MIAAEGGCLCGALRYRVMRVPKSSLICHCQTCRRASGAPGVAWITLDRAAFEWLAGSPRAYRSSPPVTRTFCGRCGSPLTYVHADHPDEIDVTTASLDEPSAYPPTREIWLEQKLPWAATDASLPRYPRNRSDGGLISPGTGS